MMLSVAVEQYVQSKRAQGYVYVTDARDLRLFVRRTGDRPICEVTSSETSAHLDGTEDRKTWREKYFRIKSFFEYWVARGELMTPPVPSLKPSKPSMFVPYVYSKQELRRLFKGTPSSQQNKACQISAETLRGVLILLYGTGISEREALELRTADVDMGRAVVRIRARPPLHLREIPIGSDLRSVLRNYMKWRSRIEARTDVLFCNKNGGSICPSTLLKSFRRLCHIVRISNPQTAQFQPNIRDLRTSFAVHRLSYWYRSGASLNRLLPALTAYLGLTTMASVERYLEITPERFRGALEVLSPSSTASPDE